MESKVGASISSQNPTMRFYRIASAFLSESMLTTIFLALFLLRQSQESCLSTGGLSFIERPNGYLDAKPFYNAEIHYSSECLIACEKENRCNAVNIKVNKDRKTCELLSGDSTTLKVNKSSTSSFFEIAQPSTASATDADKAICKPECRYIPSCKSNPLASCRCTSGLMLALHWNTIHVGPSGNNYATITVNIPSGRYILKLVSVGGFISCIGNSYFDYFNTFGCMKLDGTNEIRMVITDTNNTTVLPGANGYSHDGKISKSIFVTFNDPINLAFGQTLRIWHKDDLEDHSEADNLGLTYFRVLALKMD